MSKKKKGGRPSLYETEWKDRLIEIEGWARDGLIDEQIAANMGISTTTLYEWKKKYTEFNEALKRGKEVVDREVENALLKNALGYTYVEEQAIKVKRVYYENGKRHEAEEVEVVELKRHRAADTTAQIFWLKNRKPVEWRDKRETELTGKDGGPIQMSWVDMVVNAIEDEVEESSSESAE